jgi:hypothetical protein
VLLVDDPPLVSFPKFFHTSMNMLENVAANNEQKTDGIQPLSHKMYGVILARLVMCYNEIEWNEINFEVQEAKKLMGL